VFVRNLVFYTGLQQTDLINDEQLTAFLGQEGRALVVVPQSDLGRVEAAGAKKATRLAEFAYLNEAGLRLRYEFRKEFAPYVGVEWSRAFGDTADYIEARGGEADDTRLVVGLKAWF